MQGWTIGTLRKATTHLEGIHIVREDDNLVSSVLMILDQKLTGLEFARIHAVQQILLS